MVTRCAICRTGKVRVAETSATAMRTQPALSVGLTVKQGFIRLRIKHLGPHRHADNYVCAFFARTIAALAMQTATGDVQRVVTQMQQRIQRRISQDPDVTTAASIAARGSAARNKLLAAKCSHAVTTVASLYPNFYAIHKHTDNTLLSHDSSQI